MQCLFFFFFLFCILHHLSSVIFANTIAFAFVLLRNSRFNFHCYTQREPMSTQKSARKWHAATFSDFLRGRLQRAFTHVNQLHCIAQQMTETDRFARWPRIAVCGVCRVYNYTWQPTSPAHHPTPPPLIFFLLNILHYPLFLSVSK